MTKTEELSDEIIVNKIYFIRNKKVMVDSDLALLYGVSTRRLKEAVRRNRNRFPDDFMFEMSKEELDNWRSQIATSNFKNDKQGLRYAPFCFTEQGVAMLSSVLNSEKAILVNIQIIRTFTRIRQAVADHTELRLEIDLIKNKLDINDENMKAVFQCLDQLINKPNPPRKMIGYIESVD